MFILEDWIFFTRNTISIEFCKIASYFSFTVKSEKSNSILYFWKSYSLTFLRKLINLVFFITYS